MCLAQGPQRSDAGEARTDMVGISKALAFNIIGCNSFDPAVVLKSVTLNPIVYIFVTTFSPNLISSKLLDARLL